MNKNNCLVLSHTKEDYHDFHIESFEEYFDSLISFMYMDYFKENGFKALENKIDKIIEEDNITHIILFQWYINFVPRIEYLQKLRKKAFVISWLFDDDVFFHSNGKFYSQVVDTVVTTDYFGKIMYDQLSISSIFYLSAYDKDIYKPSSTIKDIDVSFVGWINKADREEYIQYLLDNDIKVEVYGVGSKNGKVTESEMIDIFNRSKINLNFTKIGYSMSIYEDNPLLSRIRQNKGRPIEIGLTKSFCLSESAVSLDKLFDKNSEIDTFNSKEELLQKVKLYLSDDKLREEYSKALYNKCIENYEKDIYFKKIFVELEDIKKKKNFSNLDYYDIERNKSFKIREKSFFIKYAGYQLLIKQNIKLFLENIAIVFKSDISLIPNAIVFSFKKFKQGESK